MTPKHNLRTKTTPITELTQHPKNPRNGDIDLITESLQTNGQYKPIVISEEQIILAGNHTYQAAHQLGWKTIQTLQLNIKADSPEATRIMLADNHTSTTGNYDTGLLLDILQNTDPTELTGTTYTSRDIERLINQTNQPLDLLIGLDPNADTLAQDPSKLESKLQTSTDLMRLPWAFNPTQRQAVTAAIKTLAEQHPDKDAPTLIADTLTEATTP